MTDDKKALMALMDLVLAIADAVVDHVGQCHPHGRRIVAERREVEGWRETLHLMSTEANRRRLEAATERRRAGLVVEQGLAAQTAVAATERRLRAWQGLDPIEADDSRVTDGHHSATATGTLTDIFGSPVKAHKCCGVPYRCGSYENGACAGPNDGHQCCGGKPDCGCSRSVGG